MQNKLQINSWIKISTILIFQFSPKSVDRKISLGVSKILPDTAAFYKRPIPFS